MKKADIIFGSLLDKPGDLHFDWKKFYESQNAQRLLITANSGQGKTHTCRRVLESTHGLVPQIIIDPEGEFSTLRQRFPDYLVAGADGDIKLVLKHPAAMAHQILEERISVVLDLYELLPKQRLEFVRDFINGLINSPKKLWLPTGILVDEAQMFAPENGDALSKEAMASLATRGRKRGFGAIFATLRLSDFDKQVAAPCKNKLIGGASLDVDVKRAAAELGFTKADNRRIIDLDPGEFFAYGPVFHTKEVVRIKVGPVLTAPAKTGSRYTKPMAPTAKIKAALVKLAELPQEAEQQIQDKAALQVELRSLKSQKAEMERVIKFLKENAERKGINAKPTEKQLEALKLAAKREATKMALDVCKGTLRVLKEESAKAMEGFIQTLTKELGAMELKADPITFTGLLDKAKLFGPSPFPVGEGNSLIEARLDFLKKTAPRRNIMDTTGLDFTPLRAGHTHRPQHEARR